MSDIIELLHRGKESIERGKTLLEGLGSLGDKITSSIQNGINSTLPVVAGVAHDLLGNPLDNTARPLSEAEIKELTLIFGDSIRYDEVILNDSSLMADLNSNFNDSGNSRPFVLGNTINSDGTLTQRELIHEMMHVHQYNKYGWEYLDMANDNRNYNYDFSELERIAQDSGFQDVRLEQFGIEQQGEIVADYYSLTQFSPGDTIVISDGTVVNNSNVNDVMQTYEPYIQEIHDTEPREGWQKEFDETGEEVISELGEGGEEILSEVRDGDAFGATWEVGEAGVEITGEVVEGVAETGWEVTKDGAGAIKDGAGDIIDSIFGG